VLKAEIDGGEPLDSLRSILEFTRP
jgi:hypothetical protein